MGGYHFYLSNPIINKQEIIDLVNSDNADEAILRLQETRPKVQIGKSYHDAPFWFYPPGPYDDLESLKKWLASAIIRGEDGEVYSFDRFWAIVEERGHSLTELRYLSAEECVKAIVMFAFPIETTNRLDDGARFILAREIYRVHYYVDDELVVDFIQRASKLLGLSPPAIERYISMTACRSFLDALANAALPYKESVLKMAEINPRIAVQFLVRRDVG